MTSESDGWEAVELGELCSFRAGSAFKPEFQGKPAGRYPFIKVRDLSNQENSRFIRSSANWVDDEDVASLKAKPFGAQTVVFAKIGEGLKANRFRVLAQETLIDNNLMGAIPDPSRVDPPFFHYLLQELKIPELATGSAMPYLKQGDLVKVPVDLPPLDEQHRVGRVLGVIDDKIESNRRIAATLEEIATMLFKARFVDFIDHDDLVESEIGSIPRGWRALTLGEVSDQLEVGKRPKGGVARYAYGIPSIGAESIVGLGKFDYSKVKFIPEEFFTSMKRGHVQDRDVLLYKDGGRPGAFEPHVTLVGDGFPFATFAINEHVYRLRAASELGQMFLYFWLSSDPAMAEMRVKGTGVAIPGLNSTQLRSLAVLVPPSHIVRDFERIAEDLVSRVFAACNESRTLAALRDTLLPKLMSGQIRVPTDAFEDAHAA